MPILCCICAVSLIVQEGVKAIFVYLPLVLAVGLTILIGFTCAIGLTVAGGLGSLGLIGTCLASGGLALALCIGSICFSTAIVGFLALPITIIVGILGGSVASLCALAGTGTCGLALTIIGGCLVFYLTGYGCSALVILIGLFPIVALCSPPVFFTLIIVGLGSVALVGTMGTLATVGICLCMVFSI